MTVVPKHLRELDASWKADEASRAWNKWADAKIRRALKTAAEGTGAALGPIIRDFEARIAALEGQLPAAEQRRYCGVWAADREYLRGNMATDHGSLWIVVTETTRTRPGSCSDWQLAVKRG